eukprot:257013_1
MGNKHQSISKNKGDAFIIQFNKTNVVNVGNTIACSKRVIFISLIGLVLSYKRCPPHVLYSSLLLMPLKRKWIYSSKYVTELTTASSGLLRKDATTKQFVQLLQWKDSQARTRILEQR